MKNLYYQLLLLGSPLLVNAQNNYVATMPLSATPGANNTLVGPNVGNIAMTGNENIIIGYGAGVSSTIGSKNAFLGARAGSNNTTGSGNAFVGDDAGLFNTEGQLNSFVGHAAGKSNTTGSNNTFMGYQAGNFNTIGSVNEFIGYASGYANRTGSYNVFVGTQSGNQNSTGIGSTCLGYRAGFDNNGDNNTLIGLRADVRFPNLTNAAAIGANARVSVSNAIVLGDSATGTKVGIGLTAPQFPLDVKGIINIRGQGTLKFSHLSNPNLRDGSTDRFLTVDEHGETQLATYRLRINSLAEWSDEVFGNNYALRSLSEVEHYVKRNRHLPGVPSASEVVQQGIDMEKITAILLEKVEELTLYGIQLEKANQQQRQLSQQQAQKLRVMEQKQAQTEKLLQTILKCNTSNSRRIWTN